MSTSAITIIYTVAHTSVPAENHVRARHTSTPSVGVSDWDDMHTHHSGPNVLKELDGPIDLTGHILSPFCIRDLNYQDNRFHSIAHLMCYRHAVVAGQKTFATGIKKWSKHLMDFPTTKTVDWQRQWRSMLMDIYGHLCLTDVAFKTALKQSGPVAHGHSHCIVLRHGAICPTKLTLVHAQMLSVTFWLIHVYVPQQEG